ncbi:DUF4175 domain-containing protein [soil metagenome]
MAREEGHSVLVSIRRKYIRAKMLLFTLQGLAVLLLGLAVLLRLGEENSSLALGGSVLIFGALAYVGGRWRSLRTIDLHQVARHLDRHFPQLEDSTGLLLQQAQELNLLERLQREKIAGRLPEAIREKKTVFQLSPAPSVMALAISTLLSVGILFLPASALPPVDPPEQVQLTFPELPEAAADTAGRVRKIEITVAPPAYTGKPAYDAKSPNVRAEEGATITWRISTDRPARELALVLQETKTLQASRQGNVYTFSRTFTEPALYHLLLNGQKSAYYTLEIIPDEAPVVQISKPPPYTEIRFGDPQRVTLQAQLSDDYGLRDANLIATVAKGSGEAVKFREEKISIGFSGPKRKHSVQKTLDLQQLGMTYGDELYFYLQAWDNHRGYTRSETFFVQIEDTTLVESMADLSLGMNPVPAYFRSQRQIIIDTEKLIKEQKSLSKAVFEERANTLGIDQKLLRLRYGKFLGEEFESGIGPGGGIPEGEAGSDDHFAGDGHDHPEFENKTSPEALLDPYLHKHDQEEAATFFEPAVKAQLQGALAQMWESELRLRTHRPREALPFAYKALRLLKEVQQSTRAYAAKTGFDPPPLKEPEKRLTGDLDKIKPPSHQRTLPAEPEMPHTRKALQWLERQKLSGQHTPADALLLERAGQELAREAQEKPGRYLRALQDLRTLIQEVNQNKALCRGCLRTVEQAWQELLPPATASPQKQSTPRRGMARQYVRELRSHEEL